MWNVTAGSEEVALVAAPGPNGKLLLRANGRLVTAPIAPEELEREFSFGGTRFRFTRDGETLSVDRIGEDVRPEPPSEQFLFTMRWIGGGFLAASLVALVSIFLPETLLATSAALAGVVRFRGRELVVEDSGALFFPLRLSLFASALLLGVTGFVAVRDLWPIDILRKALTAVPWLVVGMVLFAAMLTDRALHGRLHARLEWEDAMAVLDKVHTAGVTGLVLLACAAGVALYCTATRPPPLFR